MRVSEKITKTTTKMWCLRIRIKRNDEVKGKRLQKVLLDLLMNAKINSATVWTGIDGFGKRRMAADSLLVEVGSISPLISGLLIKPQTTATSQYNL